MQLCIISLCRSCRIPLSQQVCPLTMSLILPATFGDRTYVLRICLQLVALFNRMHNLNIHFNPISRFLRVPPHTPYTTQFVSRKYYYTGHKINRVSPIRHKLFLWFFIRHSVYPISWLPMQMCNSNHYNRLRINAVDDSVGKS